MCPVCFATAMLIAVSVTSTGGLAAVAMKKCGVKNAVDNPLLQHQQRRITMASSVKGAQKPYVVSHAEWLAARTELLKKEKEFTRQRDALAAERRRMPWLAVEKSYEFDGPKGKASLLDLFEGRRQLIVYRAFFEPGVFPRPRRTSGGTGTTTTTPRPRLTRGGSIYYPTLKEPLPGGATQRRKRAKEGRPLRHLRAAGSYPTGATEEGSGLVLLGR
jgi:hypothetical protein